MHEPLIILFIMMEIQNKEKNLKGDLKKKIN